MSDLIHYILSFLLQVDKNSEGMKSIGYTAESKDFDSFKVVIIPSGFFTSSNYGKPESLPSLPLAEIRGIPFVYGNSLVEKVNNTIVIHADLIASAYFFLSRYEEWVRTDANDKHGRFKGKESVAFRGGFILRPIVDEYGRFLRQILRERGVNIPEPPNKICRVYLTHDIDYAFQYRTVNGVLGSLLRSFKTGKNEIIPALRVFFGKTDKDPLYPTYLFIASKNDEFQQSTSIPVSSIFFFKSLEKKSIYDKPFYSLKSKELQRIFLLCRHKNIDIGLHSSYASGDNPELIAYEKQHLEKHTLTSVWCNRHHFLRIKNVMDMQALIQNNISDDFTMGYADIAGFRLGTSRSVRWINPQTRTVTELLLHPLTAMDKTLTGAKYMNLTHSEAFNYVCKLVDVIKEHNGEVCFLWHNNMFLQGKENHRELYSKLLDYLKK